MQLLHGRTGPAPVATEPCATVKNIPFILAEASVDYSPLHQIYDVQSSLGSCRKGTVVYKTSAEMNALIFYM